MKWMNASMSEWKAVGKPEAVYVAETKSLFWVNGEFKKNNNFWSIIVFEATERQIAIFFILIYL